MSTSDTYYTTTQKPTFELLKARYSDYITSIQKTQSIKNEVDYYIYFLNKKEKYTKNHIAKLLGYTRERVGQIVQKIHKQMGGRS